MKKFKEIIVKNILQTGKEKNANLSFDDTGIDELDKGIIYGDISRIILSLTTYVGNFVKDGGDYNFNISKNGTKVICKVDTKKEGKDKKKLAEFNRPLNFCQEYLRQHGGSISLEGNNMDVSFGNLLTKSEIPEINIAFEKAISESDAQGTKEKIEQVKAELDLPINITMKPNIQTNLMVLSTPSGSGDLNLTLGSSKASIQKDLRRKIESIFRALDNF